MSEIERAWLIVGRFYCLNERMREEIAHLQHEAAAAAEAAEKATTERDELQAKLEGWQREADAIVQKLTGELNDTRTERDELREQLQLKRYEHTRPHS